MNSIRIVVKFVSNKADRKGCPLKQDKKEIPQGGRFLDQRDWERMQRQSQGRKIRQRNRILAIMVLLLWDGLLLYMIVSCLIEAVYGAVFIAVISIYMGYQMK